MKKIALILLAAILASLCFTACGSREEELVMATNAAFPPYEYKEGDGFAGIDIEIAQAIAEKLGKKLVIEDVAFGSIIGGVQTGKYDLGIAGMTVTEDRLKNVNFSDSYATGIQVIIVKDGSQITGIDDLFNYDEEGNPVSLKNPDIKVGVQQDTTGDIYCSADVTGWGFNDLNEDESVKTNRVERYQTGADAVAALISDKVDFVIIDNEPAKSFVKANEGKIKILDTEYTLENYAIAISKDKPELLEAVNKALRELKDDGTLDKIINKYIPKGDAE